MNGIDSAARSVLAGQPHDGGTQAAGGVWKIVHEHNSAPIDFETTKAIFKR